MKFNREHLEELTLQKIKEVNDEAGYRSYLEVPEMVNIIASIIEEQLLEEFAETTLTAWENYLNKISDAILAEGKSHETQSNE
jgi:hypothetical protein